MIGRLPLATAVESASHRVGVYVGDKLRDLELTQAEAHILAQLGSNGPASVGQLLELFGHRRSTLTSVLDRLEGRGHVTRTVNPDDRRTFVVSLTDSGASTARTISKVLAEFEQAIRTRCAAGDVDGFDAVLAAIESEVSAHTLAL